METSDLDIVVKTRDAVAVYALREAFEESDIPFRVDVHKWDEMPTSFQSTIKQCFVMLQSQGKSTTKKEGETHASR